MVSNSAVFELTYSTPADLETDVKSQMKWSDHNWTGYQFTGADGLILEPTGGKKGLSKSQPEASTTSRAT